MSTWVQKEKKKAQAANNSIMVKHSPKILASEEKATATMWVFALFDFYIWTLSQSLSVLLPYTAFFVVVHRAGHNADDIAETVIMNGEFDWTEMRPGRDTVAWSCLCACMCMCSSTTDGLYTWGSVLLFSYSMEIHLFAGLYMLL